MADFTDSLLAQLGLDPAQVRQALVQVEQVVQQAAARIAQSARQVAESMRGTLLRLGSALGAALHEALRFDQLREKLNGLLRGLREDMQKLLDLGPIKSMATGIADTLLEPLRKFFDLGAHLKTFLALSPEVRKFSESLRMSMAQFQSWMGALGTVGVKPEQVGKLLEDVDTKIGIALKGGSDKFGKWLKASKIPLKDIKGAVRPVGDVLLDLADKFKGLEKFEAQDLGKKLGLDPRVVELLQEGREGVAALLEEYGKMGGYTAEHAAMAEEAETAMQKLDAALRSGSAVIASLVVPCLTALVNGLTELAKWARDNPATVKAVFVALAGAITGMALPAVRKLGAALLANPIARVFAVVIWVLRDLFAYMQGGESVLGSFWKKFGKGEEISAALKRAWEGLKSIFGSLVDIFDAQMRYAVALFSLDGAGMLAAGKNICAAFVDIFNKILEIFGLKEGFDALVADIGAAFESAAQAVMEIWEEVRQWFESLFKDIAALWEQVSNLPGKALDAAKGLGSEIAGSAGGMWEGTKEFFGEFFGADASESLRPSAVLAGGGIVNTDTRISVGDVSVHTQATDAWGMARDASAALAEMIPRQLVNASDSGVVR